MKKFFLIFFIAIIANANQVLGSEAGMPQLNPEFWVSQILWLILIFTSLYLIVWKIFLPKITYSIENRKSKIVNDLDEAQKLKERAEQKFSEYKEIIEKSKKDAKKIIKDSRKKLEKEIETKKNKYNQEIEMELKKAEKEIKNLKETSLSNINSIAVEISSEIIQNLASIEINKSSVSAIVNDLTKKEMGKNL